MFEDDHFVKAQALRMWANFVETANHNMSALEYASIGEQMPPLNASQQALVDRIRVLELDEVQLIGTDDVVS